MKVLITGGRGFLGSHLLDSVSRNHGFSVSAPSRSSLNLLDRSEVENYLLASKPDIVVHAAAVVGGIGVNHLNHFNFLASNSLIDTNLLSVCADLGIDKLICFGSSCMYPPGTGRAMPEDSLDVNSFEATNEGFAIAKTHLQNLVRFARNQRGLNWTQLILSNLYGPRDNFDPSSSHLLAAIINKILSADASSESKISIWGSGEPRREFTFAPDVSNWVAEFIRTDPADWPFRLNLGYGIDYSVMELYRLAAATIGWDGDFVLDSSKPDGAMDKLMDSSHAQLYFNWAPQTNIHDGLEHTLKWKKNKW